jgi:hypothetical protein
MINGVGSYSISIIVSFMIPEILWNWPRIPIASATGPILPGLLCCSGNYWRTELSEMNTSRGMPGI